MGAAKDAREAALKHFRSHYATGEPFPRADLPLTDALEYVCSGLPVMDSGGNKAYIYLFPMVAGDQGKAIYEECFEKYFWPTYEAKGGLQWGHFEAVYELYPADENDIQSAPHGGHRWNP